MKEIRRCFIFLNPVKNPMFTRAIFIRPDSELIREKFAHVRNCLLMKKAHGANRIVEEQKP
jgi:hypothetical protein